MFSRENGWGKKQDPECKAFDEGVNGEDDGKNQRQEQGAGPGDDEVVVMNVIVAVA